MTNFTIKIEAPALVQAIENLAAAFGNTNPLANVQMDGVKVAESAVKQIEPESKPPTPPSQKAPAKEEPKVEPVKEAPKKEKADPEEATISLEYVRSKLADHSSQGKEQQQDVKDALSRFGVKKLTDVEPKDYKELLELAGVAQ